MFRKASALFLVSLSLLLAACSDAAPNPASAGSGSMEIGFVPPAFTSPFHVAVRDGAQSIANNLGWKLDVAAADKESDFATQVFIVEQLIQKGAKAIGVTPIDSKAIITAVKKANEANVPIFMPNLITPVGAGNVAEYIGYDQFSGAEQLGEYACKVLNNIGNVYILTGIPGFAEHRRTDGFKAGLAKCPEVKVVGEQTAEWVREEGVNVATAALQQHPDINLFYGNSDEMDIGACIAAKKLGKTVNKDIYCIGIDGNAVTLDLIAKGDVTATLGVYPTKIGETMVTQMNKYMKGEKIPLILQTPVLVVDAKNLDAYKAGTTWTEPIEGKPEIDNGKPTGAA